MAATPDIGSVSSIIGWRRFKEVELPPAIMEERRKLMSIQLKPEQEQRIADALCSGAHASEDEVIDRAGCIARAGRVVIGLPNRNR
jgi:hypothetical protein